MTLDITRSPFACAYPCPAMEFADAVRNRRTHKAYRPAPIDRATLTELFELARWAPNHRLTNPWRFRVLGPRTLEIVKQLAEAAQPGAATKLDRAPTLVAVSAMQSGDAGPDREDVLATAVAAYVVLLGAHDRGLAGYWRTVPVLDTPPARAALGLAADEVVLGLLYLGHPVQQPPTPDRAPVETIATFLD